MGLDFLLACSTFFIGWLFPPFFVPIGISMIGILLMKGINPRYMLSGIGFFGMLGYIPLRYIEGYAIDVLQRHKYKISSSYVGKLIQIRIQKFLISDEEATQANSWIKEYLETRKGKIALFILAVVCTAPTIPDILTVAIFRKRMKLIPFLIAGFLGKTITFLPIIFIGKSLLSLIFDQ